MVLLHLVMIKTGGKGAQTLVPSMQYGWVVSFTLVKSQPLCCMCSHYPAYMGPSRTRPGSYHFAIPPVNADTCEHLFHNFSCWYILRIIERPIKVQENAASEMAEIDSIAPDQTVSISCHPSCGAYHLHDALYSHMISTYNWLSFSGLYDW